MTSLSPKIIRASAGTGKTFALSNRYIDLLARGEKPEKILATTFTRKAAGEIYQRIVTRLAKASLSEAAAKELASFITDQSFSSLRAQKLLRDFLNVQHRLSICTLDSLFFRIAACFSFELGMPANWTISDEVENALVLERGVSKLCAESDPQQLLALMQLLQKGDYKRSVYQQAMAEVRSLHELFRTSSWSAWSWFPEREKLLPDNISRLLEKLSLLELPKNKNSSPNKYWENATHNLTVSIGNSNWREFLENGLVLKIISQETVFARHEISEDLIEILQPLIAHARTVFLEELKMRTIATYNLLDRYDKNYQEIRKGSSSLGFSDVKHNLYNKSLSQRLDDLYYRLDTRISHLLLDEFQDTSFTEWRVLYPVLEEIIAKAGESEEHTFFCVGDVKQAIYGWRGGVAEIFDSLEESWPHLEVETAELSYRCSKEVINTVNKVFSNLDNSPINQNLPEVVELWSKRFNTHQTAKVDTEGFVSLTVCPSLEDEEHAEDIFTIAARKIKELHEKSPDLSIGVLCRTNKAVAQMIYRLLDEDISVPASEEGGNPLTDSHFVNIILAVFKLIDHPADEISAFLLSNSPLSERLGLSRDNFRETASLNSLREQIFTKGIGRFVQELSEIMQNYATERDQHRLKQLSEMAYAFESKNSDRLLEFVSFIESEKVEDPSSKNVRVMTVHQAKGLEFDTVVLLELDNLLYRNFGEKIISYHSNPINEPELISRSVPERFASIDPNLELMKSQAKSERMKEALSVLYVALTRAVHSLYMFVKEPNKLDSLPQSYAGILISTLCPELAEIPQSREIYRVGKEYSSLKKAEHLSKANKLLRKKVILKEAGSKRRKGLLRESASSREGQGRYYVEEILGVDKSYARERGLALHLLLENVSWLDSPLPEKQDFKNLFATQYQTLDLDQIYTDFLQIIEKEEIGELLTRENYPDQIELYREWPFAYRDKDAVVPGFIDRLILIKEGQQVVAAEIIDYKTDFLSAETELDKRIEFYTPQLEVYREAVARFSGLEMKNISMKLVFSSLGKVAGV